MGIILPSACKFKYICPRVVHSKPKKFCHLVKTTKIKASLQIKISNFLIFFQICHINEQWSLDYEALAKNISNATGFHSVISTSSSSAITATTNTSSNSSATSSSSHSPRARYSPDPACVRCSIYETQLEDKQQEVEDLRAMIVGLREDVKEGKDRLGLKQRELNNLESEYQILRLQVSSQTEYSLTNGGFI